MVSDKRLAVLHATEETRPAATRLMVAVPDWPLRVPVMMAD